MNWLIAFAIVLVLFAACGMVWLRVMLRRTAPTMTPTHKDCCPVCRAPFNADDDYHEYPSDFGTVCKKCFLEINKAWEEFTPDYDYYKMFYDVMLPDGTVVVHCWPNAGFMNEINDGDRKFGPKDKVKVRISRTHPMDD